MIASAPLLHAEPPTLGAGQKLLGRYVLRRLLGQGGMGIVWLAEDEELEREVALKFLPTPLVKDRASLLDLKRETKRSLELTHPHIVRTFDFLQSEDLAGISMEYVDADTLRNRRVDMPLEIFEPRDLGAWVAQLCEALDYAHRSAAIVHRDLKPANLMINRRDQLKIADFGIARSLVESMTQVTGQGISGTLVYMSPQQLAGEAPQPGDDIYAVGATLFELLTTRPPFFSGDIMGQAYRKTPPTVAERRAEFGLPKGEVPPQWEETLAACLAKAPAARPQSAGEVAVRLGLREAATLASLPVPPAKAPREVVRVPRRAEPLRAATEYFTATTRLVQRRLPRPTPAAWKRMGMVAGGALLLLAGASVLWKRPAAEVLPLAAKAEARASDAFQEPAVEKPAVGSLLVRTEPAGAMVAIGTNTPQASPVLLSALEPGVYPVRVTAAGFDDATTELTVEPGQASEPPVITMVRSMGELQVESSPAGIPFTLRSQDGALSEPQKGVTPWKAGELPVGVYELVAQREGWPEQRQRVEVKRGEAMPVKIEFVGGGVVINSEPVGAQVRQGGQELGVTPLTLPEVPPGEVAYEVQLAGFKPQEVKGEVKAGEELALTTALEAEGAPTISATGAAEPVAAPVAKEERPRSSARGVRKVSASRSSGSAPRPSNILRKAASGGRRILRVLPF